ncbi:S8 family serine peptidase [Paraburkholderia sp. BCC1884]|uniref:S8 family serine peptidase n=1 Tax=Paraburkholderia sp. BCC1884 TaxID=2562668 RepID=UPI001183041A|nr:S8 family serine peptidase [Paraburkholderia sp. BCC1884]
MQQNRFRAGRPEVRRGVLAGIACLALMLAACGGGSSADISATPISEEVAPIDAKAAAATAASSAGANTRTDTETSPTASTDPDSQAPNDRFIVKYKSDSVESRSPSAVQSRLNRLSGTSPSRAHHVRRLGAGADAVIADRKLTGKESQAFMRALAADPNVEYVEPDRVMSAQMVPNDPEYTRQWGLTSNLTNAYRFYGIRAEGAWDKASGTGVVMAAVDSGITSHSDLNANILPGYNFASPNRGGDGSDPGITTETWCTADTWHGTHVAGIMGALTNNGSGIAGLAPGAKTVPVKVLNACGTGLTSDIADGIVWAAGGSVPGVPANPHPAKIINLSLGGLGACENTMQNAINSAVSQGAIVVAAAGNNGADAANFSPANCFNVVNVGAISANGAKWVNSNFGTIVDIAAPGDNIWSTYNNGTRVPGSEGYAYMSGTSMSAPMVSGVMALVQSVAPRTLNTAEMRTLLQRSVQPFPPGQPDQPVGPGILDANAAVVAARTGNLPTAADFICREAPNLMQVTCTDRSTARGAAIAQWTWQFAGTGIADMIRTQSVNPYVNYEYPGRYLITLKLTDASGAVSTLQRPFNVTPPPVSVLDYNGSGNPSRLDGPNGSMDYYSVTVPANAASLTVTLAPGRDTDVSTLYVRADSPTMLNPICTSVMARNTAATCTIVKPKAGQWYAVSAASTKLSNAQIQYVLK